MDTLLPTAEVWLSGKPLSYFGLDVFLKRVACERTIDRTPSSQTKPTGKSKRHLCSLTFENLDGQLLGSMAIGERVEIWLGFQPERYFRGAFVITKPVFSFPESSSMEISLEGEDESAGLVNNAPARLFQNTTIGAVVKTVMATYGLDSDVDPAIAAMPVLESQSTTRESEWDYLQRVVHGSSAGMLYIEPAAPGEGKRSKLVIRPLTGTPLMNVEPRRTDEIVSIGYRVDADYWFKSVGVDLDASGPAHLGGGATGSSGAMLNIPRAGADPNIWTLQSPDGGTPTTELMQRAVLQSQPRQTNVPLFHLARAQGASEEVLRAAFAAMSVTGQGSDASAVLALNGYIVPTEVAVDVSAQAGATWLRDFSQSVQLWNSMKVRLRSELSPALPFLYPGHIVDGRGLGPFSGRLLAVTVRDEWGSEGYTQSVTWKSGQVVPPPPQKNRGAQGSYLEIPRAGGEPNLFTVTSPDAAALDQADEGY